MSAVIMSHTSEGVGLKPETSSKCHSDSTYRSKNFDLAPIEEVGEDSSDSSSSTTPNASIIPAGGNEFKMPTSSQGRGSNSRQTIRHFVPCRIPVNRQTSVSKPPGDRHRFCRQENPPPSNFPPRSRPFVQSRKQKKEDLEVENNGDSQPLAKEDDDRQDQEPVQVSQQARRLPLACGNNHPSVSYARNLAKPETFSTSSSLQEFKISPVKTHLNHKWGSSSKNWTMVTVWDPDTTKLPPLRASRQIEDYVIAGSREEFLGVFKNIFDKLSIANTRQFSEAEADVFVALVIVQDLDERVLRYSEKLELIVQELRFPSPVEREPIVQLVARGSLAEILHAVISPFDMLVVFGGYKHDGNVVALNVDKHRRTGIIRVSGNHHGGNQQISMIERIEPVFGGEKLYKFQYVALQGKMKREVTQHRTFSSEIFGRDVRETLAYQKGDRWHFPVPIVRDVDPRETYDLLFSSKLRLLSGNSPTPEKSKRQDQDQSQSPKLDEAFTTASGSSFFSWSPEKIDALKSRSEKVSKPVEAIRSRRKPQKLFKDLTTSSSSIDDLADDGDTEQFKSSQNEYFTPPSGSQRSQCTQTSRLSSSSYCRLSQGGGGGYYNGNRGFKKTDWLPGTSGGKCVGLLFIVFLFILMSFLLFLWINFLVSLNPGFCPAPAPQVRLIEHKVKIWKNEQNDVKKLMAIWEPLKLKAIEGEEEAPQELSSSGLLLRIWRMIDVIVDKVSSTCCGMAESG